MTKKLEFFFDYVSPYSYLANSQLNSIKGIEIQYRPMFLGVVMEATGNKPPGALPVRGKYLTKDIKRCFKRISLSLLHPRLETLQVVGQKNQKRGKKKKKLSSQVFFIQNPS